MIELSYESDLSYTEETEPFIIKGTALNAGGIPSKQLIVPKEELEELANSLREGEDGKGAYVLVDHDKTIESLIGRVTDAFVTDEGNRVDFEAAIFDKDKSEKIKNGLVTFVSTGLQLDREECSVCGKDFLKGGCNHRLGHEYEGKKANIVGRGLRGREISLVLFPADRGAVLQLNDTIEKIGKDKNSLLDDALIKLERKNKIKNEKQERVTMVEIIELTEEELTDHPFVENLIDINGKQLEEIESLKQVKTSLESKIKDLQTQVETFIEAEKKRAEEKHATLVTSLLEKRKEANLVEKKFEDYKEMSDGAISEMISMIDSIKSTPAKGQVNLNGEPSRTDLKEAMKKKLGWG